MNRYFFLGGILPFLKIGTAPSITFEDLIILCADNLSRKDFEKIKIFRGYIDLKNVQRLLKKVPLDPRGNFNEKELDEAIVNQEGLPRELFDFLDEYEEVSKQLHHYSKVLVAFFRKMEDKCQGFLKEYFMFERKWKALLAGYRAKKFGIDLVLALQYEDFCDPFIAEILAQKDAPFFEFPFEYAQLGEKLKAANQKAYEQYQLINDFRIHWIQDKVQDHPFSIDYFIGYLIQLMIIEDVFILDEKKGSANLKKMVKGNV